MASISLPPPPASTRPDWGRGERGSAFRGVGRGRGSASRGERGTRGGRGGRRGGTSTRSNKAHGSPPSASDSTPTTTTEAKPAQPSVPPTSTSTSTKNSSSHPRSSPVLDLPPKPKVSTRRTSQHAANNLPSLKIEPASPTVNLSGSAPQSASTSTSKPSMRRRRSQNKSSVPTLSSENLTVEALASAMKARKSRTSPSSPQGPPKASASKDAPPHLSAGPTVTSFSTKTNIDSLVEHVRALAMDPRPSTPGSHIDWAGDEDDSLPDLDDWGVSPGSGTPADANPGPSEVIEKARLELMSPILDDSLKQLPQSFDKASPSPAVSGAPSPRIADAAPVSEVNGLEDAHNTAVSDTSSSPIEANEPEDHAPRSSEPSLREDSPTSPEPAPPSKDQDTPPHLASADSVSPAPTSATTPPLPQSGRGLGDSIHAPPRSERASSEAPPEAHGAELECDDIGKRGLTASIHAPKTSSSSDSQLSDPKPELRVPTHGRSRTLGRPPTFSFGAKHGFLSGSSTPAAAARAGTKGPNHARTQSTPASRQRHGRPVLTTDAMSRLARTLGTAPPNKKEVVATNLAASSE
ncbi:hypothetical protein V8E53_015114 [Lactarius tabidus]